MYLQISDGTYEAYADILVQDEFVDIAGRDVFSYVFSSIVLLSAFLFIFNFKVRKPNNRTAIFLVLFGILIVLGLIFIP